VFLRRRRQLLPLSEAKPWTEAARSIKWPGNKPTTASPRVAAAPPAAAVVPLRRRLPLHPPATTTMSQPSEPTSEPDPSQSESAPGMQGKFFTLSLMFFRSAVLCHPEIETCVEL